MKVLMFIMKPKEQQYENIYFITENLAYGVPSV